jgi:hypothetical protein
MNLFVLSAFAWHLAVKGPVTGRITCTVFWFASFISILMAHEKPDGESRRAGS